MYTVQVQLIKLQESSVCPMEMSAEQKYVIKEYQIKISVKLDFEDWFLKTFNPIDTGFLNLFLDKGFLNLFLDKGF